MGKKKTSSVIPRKQESAAEKGKPLNIFRQELGADKIAFFNAAQSKQ